MRKRPIKIISIIICAIMLFCSCNPEPDMIITKEELYNGLIRVDFYKVESVRFIDGYGAYVHEVLHVLTDDEIEECINAISQSKFYYVYGAPHGSYPGFKFYYEDETLDFTIDDWNAKGKMGNWEGEISNLLSKYVSLYIYGVK